MAEADGVNAERLLEARLDALLKLPRHRLLAEFEKTYRRPPPLRLSDTILRLAIAYRLQEQAYGGLKPEIRRALLEGKPRSHLPAGPGTILIREWHGVEHVVTVHADRVEYRGERYRSLSVVARLITGQRRSGPNFFGLRAKRHG